MREKELSPLQQSWRTGRGTGGGEGVALGSPLCFPDTNSKLRDSGEGGYGNNLSMGVGDGTASEQGNVEQPDPSPDALSMAAAPPAPPRPPLSRKFRFDDNYTTKDTTL